MITATRLGLNPILMAAANSAGGGMGKTISLQSLAVAVTATGMKTTDEDLPNGKEPSFTTALTVFW